MALLLLLPAQWLRLQQMGSYSSSNSREGPRAPRDRWCMLPPQRQHQLTHRLLRLMQLLLPRVLGQAAAAAVATRRMQQRLLTAHIRLGMLQLRQQNTCRRLCWSLVLRLPRCTSR
jgi:hypothetical protein